MKVLIITNFVPYPPTTGAVLRIFNLLRQISRHHEVSLLSLFQPSTEKDNGVAHLGPFCDRVELVVRRKRSRRERWLTTLQGVVEREPRRNLLLQFQEMSNKIRTWTENEHFDIIDIQHLNMAPYIKAISPTSHCCKILTLHNVDYVQYRRIMSTERDWRVKRKLFFKNFMFSKQATLRYARRFDKCVVVSELDRNVLKRDAPDLDIAVVPNGVDTTSYPFLTDQPTTSTLLFVGTMNYSPNVDGAIFFCHEIFPLIKQRVADANLLIVGREPTDAVRALASDDVTVTGYVDSVIPYYQQSLVSVIPLRAGGGTRLKILESMALGRPVVSTTLGCEGLAVTHDENILIADTPADFAAQTARLLKDQELRRRLVANGRQLVETTYDWQSIGHQLLQVYDETKSKR